MNEYTKEIIKGNIEYLTGIIKGEYGRIAEYEKQILTIKSRIATYDKQLKELTIDLDEKPDLAEEK
jgi:hypothetical protein